MRYMFHIIFLILFSCFQGTLTSLFSVFGIEPNLFIIYICIVSMLASRREAVTVSGVFGVILDILNGRYALFYTVLFIITAFFLCGLSEKVLKESKFYVCSLMVFFVTLFIDVVYYVIVFYLNEKLNLGYAFFRVIIPEGIYNGIVAILIYMLVKHITKNFYNNKGEFIG